MALVALALAACSGRSQEPSPPVGPEGHRHGLIFERMSEDDLLCIPRTVHTDEEMVDYVLSMSVSDYDLLTRCLSYEGRFEIFVVENASMNLTRDENRCLWDGMDLMNRLETERRPTVSLNAPSEDVALVSTAMVAYCMREQGFIPGDWERTSDNDSRRRAMICLVEQAGGPRPFLTENLGAGVLAGVLAEAEAGDGPCGLTEAGEL